jgi:hypothetical protein
MRQGPVFRKCETGNWDCEKRNCSILLRLDPSDMPPQL